MLLKHHDRRVEGEGRSSGKYTPIMGVDDTKEDDRLWVGEDGGGGEDVYTVELAEVLDRGEAVGESARAAARSAGGEFERSLR